MAANRVEVPDDLRRTIGSWAGEAGKEWLASLPSRVETLAEAWGLTLGEPYQPSGYTALTLRVSLPSGVPAVLKVGLTDEWTAPAPEALRIWDGDGAVRVLADDPAHGASLLERCSPGTSLLAEADDVAARVCAETATALWRPVPDDHPFVRLPSAAPGWAETVRSSSAVAAALRDETLEVLAWLGAPVESPVLVHGDLHPGNVLRAERLPWLAIDPQPVVGDPAYGLASMIRDRPSPVAVPRRFAIACEVTGLAPERIRGWALVQAVEGAAWCAEVGDAKNAAEFTEAAELIAALRA